MGNEIKEKYKNEKEVIRVINEEDRAELQKLLEEVNKNDVWYNVLQ